MDRIALRQQTQTTLLDQIRDQGKKFDQIRDQGKKLLAMLGSLVDVSVEDATALDGSSPTRSSSDSADEEEDNYPDVQKCTISTEILRCAVDVFEHPGKLRGFAT